MKRRQVFGNSSIFFRKIINLVKTIRNKIGQGQKVNEVFEGDEESLKMSSITLDLRNPLLAKKYFCLGRDCSINATLCFETQEGYVKVGNRVFAGGLQIITRTKVQIDDNVQIAWNVLLYDHNAHSFDWRERRKDIDVYLNNKRRGKDVLKNDGKNWGGGYTLPLFTFAKMLGLEKESLF